MSQDDSQSLLARVTRDGIVETAVKESVDFIVRLGERPDVGRNIYKQVFPKSKDKAKEKTDSFSFLELILTKEIYLPILMFIVLIVLSIILKKKFFNV